MTKKIFLGMSAMAMLFATSCKDDFAESFVGDQATVEFSISTPEIATRAFSEGDEIKHLHYAIYDGEDLLDNLGLSTEFATAGDTSVNLSLTLKTGKTYKAIFWADAVDAPYDVVFTDGGATMTMKDQTIYSNDESLDAFYEVVDITITGNQQVPVYLKRPFAQINFGTNDIGTAAAVGFDVDQTAMEVSVYTQMDLFNNSVVADSQTTKRFEYAAIPQGEQFPVDNYDYLAMNYVLVGEKQTADVTFYYKDTTGDEMSKHVGAVPMQRNYRTNIYGSVLTSTADVLVQVVPDFGGNENKQIVQVATLADLQAAIENESVGEIVLTNDIEVTKTLVFGSKPSANPAPTRSEAATLRTYVLDLNGKTLETGLEREGRHHYAIDNYANLVIEGDGAINARGIKNYGELTVNGNVTVKNLDSNGGAAIWNEGKVTINNGTFISSEKAGANSDGAALNIRENASATVNGGVFRSEATHCYAIICGGNLTINNADVKGKHGAVGAFGKANIEIKDGKFEQIDNPNTSDHCILGKGVAPDVNNQNVTLEIKGGQYKIEDCAEKNGGQVFWGECLADGYSAVEADGWYQVIKGEGIQAIVATEDQLAEAVADGKTNLYLLDGEYNVANCGGKTLTLSGSINAVLKVMNEGEDGCDYGFDRSTVTFNGLTINTTANNGNYKGYTRLTATYNDCNFVGAYTSHMVQTFNNCTFDFKNGYFWIWGAKEVNFNGCTFNGNSKNILAHGWESSVININDCAFAATEKGYTGAGDNTACVEIDPAGSNVYTINFTGNNTKTDSYNGWTRVKDNSTGHTITGLN